MTMSRVEAELGGVAEADEQEAGTHREATSWVMPTPPNSSTLIRKVLIVLNIALNDLHAAPSSSNIPFSTAHCPAAHCSCLKRFEDVSCKLDDETHKSHRSCRHSSRVLQPAATFECESGGNLFSTAVIACRQVPFTNWHNRPYKLNRGNIILYKYSGHWMGPTFSPSLTRALTEKGPTSLSSLRGVDLALLLAPRLEGTGMTAGSSVLSRDNDSVINNTCKASARCSARPEAKKLSHASSSSSSSARGLSTGCCESLEVKLRRESERSLLLPLVVMVDEESEEFAGISDLLWNRASCNIVNMQHKTAACISSHKSSDWALLSIPDSELSNKQHNSGPPWDINTALIASP
mmetsp:Transcript_13535/g.22264  ORF Transcript_13535/g.22264 Transcript_13535/m.22264 type:complete len:350 (-) Transcript_13535:3756-4805(-)